MKGHKPGTLIRNKLPARIVQFFEANPDEELTVGDAAVKFNTTNKRIAQALARLRGTSHIEGVQIIRVRRP